MASHTEFETATLCYALLKEYSEELASEFCGLAFPHDQDRENAQAIISSLPPTFIHTLITSSLPDTTFKSIIQNPRTFEKPVMARKEQIFYDRVKKLFLTYRVVGHTRTVHALCIDPANVLIFTGSDDSLIKVWHVASLSLVCTLKGHEDGRRVVGLTMSPDHRLLASWSDDRFVRLWSLVDGACVSVVPCDVEEQRDREIRDVVFSPCNRFLAIAVEQSVRVLRITDLVPSLAAAHKDISEGRDVLAGNAIFANDMERFNHYDPARFLESPPKTQRQLQLKANVMCVAFSPGGNLMATALESGSVVVVGMTSGRRWTIQVHEANADGVMFLKDDFHQMLTWSQKGGEVKLWKFMDKSRELATFSVRKVARRAHLVAISVSCDASLLFACTSTTVFAWKLRAAKGDKVRKPILHVDDSVLMTQVSDVQAHPFLPSVFLAVTKAVSAPITIWDVNSPDKPIHTLMTPVEMNKVQMARWGADGVSVVASDTQGGVFLFRVAEDPVCRTMPQFFPTDFTASEWVAEVGQVEEATKCPTHLNSRTTLLNVDRNPIYDDFSPYSLKELEVTPVFPSATKYSWLSEELWVKKSPQLSEPKVPDVKPPVPFQKAPELQMLAMQSDTGSDVESDDESDSDAKVPEPSSESDSFSRSDDE